MKTVITPPSNLTPHAEVYSDGKKYNNHVGLGNQASKANISGFIVVKNSRQMSSQYPTTVLEE